MVIRAKVPALTAKGARIVVPKAMEIKPKMPGAAPAWTAGAISRRFGAKKDWGKIR
jgi:hypothetical protein